jgi:hypothetical protein
MQDLEDQLEHILEPGEQVVWSDRPHHRPAFWRACRSWKDPYWLVPLAGFTLVVVIATIPLVVYQLEHLDQALLPSVTNPALAVLFLGHATLAAIYAPILLRFLKALGELYAITDRGRVIVVSRGKPVFYELPSPEAIELDAAADARFGTIDLFGDEPVAFQGIAAPHATFERIQAMAREHAAARERPDSVFAPREGPGREAGDMRRALDRWRARKK